MKRSLRGFRTKGPRLLQLMAMECKPILSLARVLRQQDLPVVLAQRRSKLLCPLQPRQQVFQKRIAVILIRLRRHQQQQCRLCPFLRAVSLRQSDNYHVHCPREIRHMRSRFRAVAGLYRTRQAIVEQVRAKLLMNAKTIRMIHEEPVPRQLDHLNRELLSRQAGLKVCRLEAGRQNGLMIRVRRNDVW